MVNLLTEDYHRADRKLILLDFDGTIVEHASRPENVKPSLHAIHTLSALTLQPNTRVFIISGRRQSDIDRLVGDLPIDIIAEHGAAVKEAGQWQQQILDPGSWKSTARHIFNRITSSCPNSFVEEKDFALTWHYRNAEPISGSMHATELIHAIRETAQSNHLRIIDGNKIIEVMPETISKGEAVRYVMNQHSYDYILAAGDDKTDEDMFSVLRSCDFAHTIKVGPGETLAKHRLASPSAVIALLDDLITQSVSNV